MKVILYIMVSLTAFYTMVCVKSQVWSCVLVVSNGDLKKLQRVCTDDSSGSNTFHISMRIWIRILSIHIKKKISEMILNDAVLYTYISASSSSHQRVFSSNK